MKKLLAVVMALTVVTAGVAVAQDAKAPSKDDTGKAVVRQLTCPVMGGAINTNIFVDVEGKRIYLCCKGCIDAVKKDPAKFIAKLEESGVTVEKAPEPIKKDAGKQDAEKAPAAK